MSGLTTTTLLAADKRDLVDRMRELARERFAPRADDYDRRAVFPREDFDDLVAAGLHAPALPCEAGGLGLGPWRGDAFSLWMLTREVARADLALARCWEGHLNAQVLLDAMARGEQRERWFSEIVERGAIWAAWSGEPQRRIPGQRAAIGTEVERVAGGFRITGTKVFSTSAGAARWAILLVSTAGAGGVRHATGPLDSQLALVCDLRDPSVSFDSGWWDPIGMRATVSYLARFDGTFIPAENQLGEPGQYLREDWQARFTPHYAASFLGAAQAALDCALENVRVTDRAGDPHVQHRIARMVTAVDSGQLWIHHVAKLWDTGQIALAKDAGSRARHLVEHWADQVIREAVHVCGARALNRPSALERIVRDFTFYARHDNADQVLATIGAVALGQAHDLSFHRGSGG
jgi:alkylation response protein AidB-like acyl-CoA dehydrogenase